MADASAALGPHRSTSSNTGAFRVPYEIYLLIVDAFLESAYAEISSQPVTWGLGNSKCLQMTLLVFTYPTDGRRTRLYRHRRLSIIAQIDRKSRSLVDRRFPRFHYHGLSANSRGRPSAACVQFAYVCPTVDVFQVYCSNQSLSQSDSQSPDMLRVVENIQYEGTLCPEIFTAMPHLKSLTLCTKPLGVKFIFDEHDHHMVLPAEKIGRLFDQDQWNSICSYSSRWAGGTRLFLNDGRWSTGEWPAGELLFDPLVKGLPFRLRIFADGCEECRYVCPPWKTIDGPLSYGSQPMLITSVAKLLLDVMHGSWPAYCHPQKTT